MENQRSEKLGVIGAAGLLGLGLIASTWHLWRGPVLVALFLALGLVSLGLRPKGPAMWFLAVAGLVLPLTSLAHDRDFEHFYGLAVFLILGCTGLMVGLHSSAVSIVFGALLFQCVVIVSTLWTVVATPENAFNVSQDYYFGALTGPFEHRNTLGAFLGLGMAALLSGHRGTRSEAMRTFLFAISSALLFATQSLTPVLALCAASLFVAWRLNKEKFSGFFNLKTKAFKRLLVANGVALASVIVVILLPGMLKLRESLGGRFLIWDVVIRKLLEEFPNPPATQWIASEEVLRELGYNPSHAHNALLNLFLIYGILPTIVFVAAIICAVAVSPSVPAGVRGGDTNEIITAQGLLVYMFIHGIVEPVLLAGPVGALLVGAFAGTALAPKRPPFSA